MTTVLHIFPRISYTGGTENFAKNLLLKWNRKNDKVLICTFYPYNNQELLLELKNIKSKIITLRDFLPGTFKNRFINILIKNSFIPYIYKFCQLKRIIKEESPDVIFIQGEDSELVAGLTNNKVRKVNFIHSEVDFPKNIFYRFILNSFSRKRFHYTFIVNKKLSKIPEKHRITYQLIKPYIDESYFTFDSTKKFDRDKINIGYIGRIVKEKGLKELLLAFKILKLKFQSAKLYFAGTGVYFSTLKNLAEKKLFLDDVIFLDETSRPWEFYKEMDIVVLPSRFEALPLTLLEAMAVGSVVISTNVGGISDIIINEVNGLLIDNNSPESIANAIMKIVNDDALRERMRKNAYESVKPFFNYKANDNIEQCLKFLRID